MKLEQAIKGRWPDETIELGQKKKKWDMLEWPVYGLLAGLLLIQLAVPLRVGALVSLGTWMIAGSAVLAFAVTLSARKWSIPKFLMLIFLLLITFLSIVASLDFTAGNLVAGLCFLEIPLVLGSYQEIKKKSVKRAIYISYVILSVYYIVLSMTSLSHTYSTKYGEVDMPFLTLGYNNPNETAMYLFACVIILAALMRDLKLPLLKILVGVDIAVIMVLVIRTLSRTSMIMSIAFLLLTFLFRKRKLPGVLGALCLAVPVLFLIVTLWGGDLMAGLQIFGETVETGRNEIYTEVLNELDILSFLIGDFTFRFRNLHNGFWSIFATIGMMGMVIFLSFLSMVLGKAHRRMTQTGGDKLAILGLFLLIAYTATEAAFFTAGSVFAAEVSAIYLIGVSGSGLSRPVETEEEDA